MRRSLTAATALFAAMVLVGCGKKPRPAPEPEPEPTPAAVTPTPLPPAGGPTPPTTPMPPVAAVPPTNPIPPFVAYGGQPMPEPAVPVAPMPAQPGGGVAAQPPPPPVPFQPLPPPPEVKEKDKGGSTSVKAEWPKDINGKTLADTIKDCFDLDPAVRERSLRTIPAFGPEIVKKEAGWPKAVLARMNGEKELDPGVRAAAYESLGLVGLDKDADIKEAVRILALASEAGGGNNGGGARLHAIQTLSAFGSKAEGAINYLIGPPLMDRAFETRRTVAFTLGRIALNEQNGPGHRVLDALLKLAADHSAPVRMEAYQSLVILGPPLAPRPPGSTPLKDVKNGAEVRIDEKAAGYVAIIKKRLAPAPPGKGNEPPSPTGLVERDKQVEIMARLVVMRFEPKEVTEEHLGALARYVNDKETGVRLQALNVLGMMGQAGAKKIDDVTQALASEDATVVVAALTALVQFGPRAKDALPTVERLRTRGMTKEEKEYWQKLVDQAVKLIKDADKKA